MSAQPPRPDPDDPHFPGLTPPADPWSGAPLSTPDPLFPTSPHPAADPLAQPEPLPASPSPASGSPASPSPVSGSPASPPSASALPAEPGPPVVPLPSPYGPTTPQQPWYPPTSAMPEQPGFPPPAYPAQGPVPSWSPADRPPPAYPSQPVDAVPPLYPQPVDAVPSPYSQAPYYSPPPYAAGPVRSLRIPARLAIGGLAATAVLSLLVQAVAYSYSASLAGDRIDWLAAAAFIPYGVVFLFTAVVFLVWLHRASTNLWNTGHAMKWRPGWTVGAWFIPLANLVLPLLVIREVDRSARDHGSGLFALWAVAWTLDLLLERTSRVLAPYAGVGLLSAITLPVAGVAAALLVRRITADHDRFTQPH
jgi:Domain of unknown function (DUF4328)